MLCYVIYQPNLEVKGMAREGVTYEEVVAAALSLENEGIKVTTRNVRERLGDVGSMNTILAHLGQWRTTKPSTREHNATVSQTLINAIAKEIGEAATKARSAIQEELQQAQLEALERARSGEALEQANEALAQKVTQLTFERDTLLSEIDKQAQVFNATEEKIRLEFKTSEEKRIQAEKELAVIKTKLDLAASHAQKYEERVDALNKQLEFEREAKHAAKLEANEATAQLKILFQKNQA